MHLTLCHGQPHLGGFYTTSHVPTVEALQLVDLTKICHINLLPWIHWEGKELASEISASPFPHFFNCSIRLTLLHFTIQRALFERKDPRIKTNNKPKCWQKGDETSKTESRINEGHLMPKIADLLAAKKESQEEGRNMRRTWLCPYEMEAWHGRKCFSIKQEC